MPATRQRLEDPLLELLRAGDAQAREVELFDGIDHCGEDLAAGEFGAGGKLGVFADLVEVVDLLSIQGGNDAMGPMMKILLV